MISLEFLSSGPTYNSEPMRRSIFLHKDWEYEIKSTCIHKFDISEVLTWIIDIEFITMISSFWVSPSAVTSFSEKTLSVLGPLALYANSDTYFI